MSENLRTRLISGIGIGIVTITAGLLGGAWWGVFVLVVAVRASDEMTGLMRASGFRPTRLLALFTAAAAFSAVWFQPAPVIFGAGLSITLLSSLAWQMRDREGAPIANWALTLVSGGYIGWCAGHLALLRDAHNGLAWVIVAIGGTWLADSAAYLVGSRFGRVKLAPGLSPKKTREGYLGGVAAATIGGALMGVLLPEIGPVKATALAMLAGLVGTVGDLAESMVKRQAHAKDSGALIPGHGGAFDRIDSLLWAGVFVYYVSALVGQ